MSLLYFQKYILIANKAATFSNTFLWQIDSFSVQWTHAEWRVPAVPHPFRQALEKIFIFGKVLHISFVELKFWSHQVVLQWIHCLICKAPHIFCDFILTSLFLINLMSLSHMFLERLLDTYPILWQFLSLLPSLLRLFDW